MPRYTIVRTRSRKVYETSTYELDAENEDAAKLLAIEDDGNDNWIADDSETMTIHTEAREIAEPDEG
jgi:hypothetical protein